MKKGFTLVELMIVVAIIGALMMLVAALLPGTGEAARAANCLANMKNLSNGVQSYMGGNGRYPLAGSIECMGINTSGGNGVKKSYWEVPGWISWDSRNAYSGGASSHVANGGWFTSAYNQDRDVREFALTNGALWKAVSASRSCYTCPAHVIKMPESAKPNWSYVMNAHFNWDKSEGAKASASKEPRVLRESVKRADKVLLFAELPWANYTGENPDTSSSSGTKNDCVLQYRNCGGGNAETIGFCHKSGRDIYANVVFADGHAEQIVWKREQNMEELTEWLCTGKDVIYDNGQYKELE